MQIQAQTPPKKRSIKKAPKSPSKVNTFEKVISLLEKGRKQRTVQNKKVISEYLSEKFTYFKKLKDQSDFEKLDKITSVINYEIFNKGEKIINCGDEGDKFYVLLEGQVGIYKPFPKEMEMTFREYVEYLCRARDEEHNYPKFKRVTLQNPEVDHFALKRINFDYTQISHGKKKIFILEEDKKLAEFGGGFAFGEMALIKREPRNATIIALDNCKLVSIDKIDYNKIIREIEEKRLGHVIREFKNDFPLFEYWGGYQCLRMFNFLEKESLSFGDYLYKQNDSSDAIYFVKSGKFEMSTSVSFAWYEEFINFIYDSSFSLVNRMDKKELFSEEEIKSFMNLARSVIQSPCNVNKKKKNITTSFNKEGNLVDIKLEQDDLSNPEHFFKANIKTVSAPECVGFEDALELKPRYCSIKCISKTAEVQKVNLFEFIKLIPHDQKNQFIFQQSVFEKKMYLVQQLKNNTAARLNLIDDTMKIKYETAVVKEFPELYGKKKFHNDKKFKKTNNNLMNITRNLSTISLQKVKSSDNEAKSIVKCNSTGNIFSNPSIKQNAFLDYDKIVDDTEPEFSPLKNINIKSKLLRQSSISFSTIKRNKVAFDINEKTTKSVNIINFNKFKELASEICKMEKIILNKKPLYDIDKSYNYIDIQSSKSTTHFSSNNQSSILSRSNQRNSVDISPKPQSIEKLPKIKKGIPTEIKMKYFRNTFFKDLSRFKKKWSK